MFFWNSCFFDDPADVGNLVSGPKRAPSPPCISVFKNRSKVRCLIVPSVLYQAQHSEEALTFGQPMKLSFYTENKGASLCSMLITAPQLPCRDAMHQKCPINLHRPGHHPPELHGEISFQREAFRQVDFNPHSGYSGDQGQIGLCPARSPLVLQEMF